MILDKRPMLAVIVGQKSLYFFLKPKRQPLIICSSLVMIHIDAAAQHKLVAHEENLLSVGLK